MFSHFVKIHPFGEMLFSRLSEQQRLVDEISSHKQEITSLLADADKQLAQKEIRITELTSRENDIKGRIKSIEDSGQILTLKQIEKISPKVHAPVIGGQAIAKKFGYKKLTEEMKTARLDGV